MILLLSSLIAFTNPLRPLEHFLQRVLIWLHETVGFSWAWSIVALTVIVRICSSRSRSSRSTRCRTCRRTRRR